MSENNIDFSDFSENYKKKSGLVNLKQNYNTLTENRKSIVSEYKNSKYMSTKKNSLDNIGKISELNIIGNKEEKEKNNDLNIVKDSNKDNNLENIEKNLEIKNDINKVDDVINIVDKEIKNSSLKNQIHNLNINIYAPKVKIPIKQVNIENHYSSTNNKKEEQKNKLQCLNKDYSCLNNMHNKKRCESDMYQIENGQLEEHMVILTKQNDELSDEINNIIKDDNQMANILNRTDRMSTMLKTNDNIISQMPYRENCYQTYKSQMYPDCDIMNNRMNFSQGFERRRCMSPNSKYTYSRLENTNKY